MSEPSKRPPRSGSGGGTGSAFGGAMASEVRAGMLKSAGSTALVGGTAHVGSLADAGTVGSSAASAGMAMFAKLVQTLVSRMMGILSKLSVCDGGPNVDGRGPLTVG